MKTIQKKVNSLTTRMNLAWMHTRQKLRETSGQFVMDHAAVFIIIIVLAGLTLGLLVVYVENDFSNSLKSKLNELFNF